METFITLIKMFNYEESLVYSRTLGLLEKVLRPFPQCSLV